MDSMLHDLKPQPVFQYFEEISMIPRASGNERAISDHLVSFGKKHGLDVIQDEMMNVIIKKGGSKGYEQSPTVIIQGHMDMVPEKNQQTLHDFEKDPIRLRIIEDMLYATDTTLGADNGIALAYGLALLASTDIPHPPLEVLFTVEEETGMGGAMALDPKHLNGKLLINLDSEEEGKLLVSCAGGIRTTQVLPILWEDPNKDYLPYILSIRGLKGGHSGMEIHKGRGNANKLLGRLLSDLSTNLTFSIHEIHGGAKMNAVPRESDAIILIDPRDRSLLVDKVAAWEAIFRNELRSSDPEILIECRKYEKPVSRVFSKDTMDKAIASLVLIPNGIQSMSMDIENLVESSTNLGVVTTDGQSITFQSAIRSSVKSLKYHILDQSKMVAHTLGCELLSDSDYPEWSFNPDSKLQKLFEKVYEEKYGVPPEIVAIHAGVECGLLNEKLGDLDMISLGPNMYDVHTPNEHLNVSSTERTWEYLLAVLEEIR